VNAKWNNKRQNKSLDFHVRTPSRVEILLAICNDRQGATRNFSGKEKFSHLWTIDWHGSTFHTMSCILQHTKKFTCCWQLEQKQLAAQVRGFGPRFAETDRKSIKQTPRAT
jgi:hypothetical protein